MIILWLNIHFTRLYDFVVTHTEAKTSDQASLSLLRLWGFFRSSFPKNGVSRHLKMGVSRHLKKKGVSVATLKTSEIIRNN